MLDSPVSFGYSVYINYTGVMTMLNLDSIEKKCDAYDRSIGRSCSTVLSVSEIRELLEYTRSLEALVKLNSDSDQPLPEPVTA